MVGSGWRKPLADVHPSMYEIVARGGPVHNCPIVTVVVPSRDRERLLADAIDALFRQEFPSSDYEIVVIDNASNDGTVRLLQEKARESPVPFLGVRLRRDSGPAMARNVGVYLARGRLLAFTDSDCVPTRRWLASCLGAFADGIGTVQGRTIAHPGQRQPLFNHFIETLRFDGSFSTSNVCYRREVLEVAGGFDPGCHYWEDVDLGWRVQRLGWRAVFAPQALVYHQVLTLGPLGWLRHAVRAHNWPAKVARYPELRRHLFLGLWVHPWHLLFQSFLLGLLLGCWRRPFLVLAVPYLVIFPLRRRFVGRWPALKAVAHLARDAVTLVALLAGSVRFRRLVL